MSGLTAALRPVYPQILHAQGARFTIADHRRLLDLSSQTLNLALGQSHPRVSAAVIDQVHAAQFASSRFGTRPFLDLAQRLAELAPSGVNEVVLKLSNGSDAVETAMKIAMLHTRRRLVGCLPGAWHGESFLTLGLATTHRGRLLGEDTRTVVADGDDVEALTRMVAGRHDLAAVVLDPALVSTGLPATDITAELAGLRRACDNTGTLLIFDEIQTFGWLGRHLFIADALGVRPDLICLGKALGAGFPLAAVLARADLAAVLQYNDAEFTYGGHPVSCAAALASLDLLQELSNELDDRVQMFTDMLATCFSSGMFEVRQVGLIASVTLAEDRLREVWTSRTAARCLSDGIYLRPNNHGRRLLIKPPVVLPIDELRRAMSRVAEAAANACEQLKPNSTSTDLRSSPRVIHEPRKSYSNAGGLDALLRAVDPGLHVRARTPREQQDLTRRLADIGVPVAAVYAVAGQDGVEYGEILGRTLHVILADPATDAALTNGLALRHHELLTRAHDHGIVIGDRRLDNTVVTDRGDLWLINVGIGYHGPVATLALVEETASVAETILAIHPTNPLRHDLLTRLVSALVARHGRLSSYEVMRQVVNAATQGPIHPVCARGEAAGTDRVEILGRLLSGIQTNTRPTTAGVLTEV